MLIFQVILLDYCCSPYAISRAIALLFRLATNRYFGYRCKPQVTGHAQT